MPCKIMPLAGTFVDFVSVLVNILVEVNLVTITNVVVFSVGPCTFYSINFSNFTFSSDFSLFTHRQFVPVVTRDL